MPKPFVMSLPIFAALIMVASYMVNVLTPSSDGSPKVLSRICVKTERTSDNGVTLGLTTGAWIPTYTTNCVRWVPEVAEP